MSVSIAHDVSNGTSSSISCTEFLAALYQGIDPSLWLELRCIHPTSAGKPQTRWLPVGKAANALNQVKSLNAEGYGVFFVPCPRRERKGSAEYAAVIPALWADIDCNSDPIKRERGLALLTAFDPLPSAIIDSGGGWHPYWFLDAPFALTDNVARERVAAIAHGLFAALDGDPEYVKSVASIMRLPGLVNTKPERNGALVAVTHFEPERRYLLSAFDWLAVKPNTAQFRLDAHTNNGYAPLPQSTLDYLNNGAAVEHRNHALFAAACQFRDAGYSQSEAEAQLVSRYLADGSGEPGREREAQATIASAYSRVARDPLLQAPVHHQSSPPAKKPPTNIVASSDAHQQVTTLIEQFEQAQPQAQNTSPTAEQIAQAVIGCADLDPIAWAAERKRIKAICGEDYRLTDLDRMHKRAQRDAHKAVVSSSALPTERYYIEDGWIIYERFTAHGKSRQIVASWTGRILEWITAVEDDGQTEHVMRLELTHTGKTITLDVPSELFGDANAVTRFIAGRAGGLYTVRAGMNKHLVPALLALSGEPVQKTTYRFIGWTKVDGKWAYVSPNTSIAASGTLEQPPTVELEGRLRDYSLTDTDWTRSLSAFAAVRDALPPNLAPALLTFAMLPLVQRFFPAAAPRPALHLVGTTGSGKSEIAALLTSFYGQFTRDSPPSQWGDTVNTVETLGFPLADALYWVDDYKTCYADERTFTRFLQSYSRGMGRGRLTREAKLRQERPCRGLLLSTGETTIEGEASVLARMLVLEIPPWERRDPGGILNTHADSKRGELTGFTAHFAAWIAHRADDGTLSKQIAERFDANVHSYREKLKSTGGGQASTGRMIQNWAVLLTVYELLRDFLTGRDAEYALPLWQDVLTHTVQTVQQERAGEVFLNLLAQLLASGDAQIASNIHEPDAPRTNAPIIGYFGDEHILLLPEIAYRAVCQMRPQLKFTMAAIGAQLKEDGKLLPGASALTVQRRVRGIVTRVWQLKLDFLLVEDAELSELH